MVSLDNVGVWNLRTENLDSWYLGQETYVRVVNPEVNNKTELPIPDNALFCGALSKLQKYATNPCLLTKPALTSKLCMVLNFEVNYVWFFSFWPQMEGSRIQA